MKNGEYNLKVNYLIPNLENPLKGLTILIDAGHGGHENGAIGCLGDKEKDINLDVAFVRVTVSSNFVLECSDKVKVRNGRMKNVI
jgi:hypothetical protein